MAAEARAREAEANDAPGAPDAAPDRRAEAQGEKIKIGGDLELTENEIRDLVSRKAAEDSKSLTRPQKAEDFKFGLSPNFQPPAGLGCVAARRRGAPDERAQEGRSREARRSRDAESRRCRAVDDRDDGYRCGGYGAGSAGGANGINHRCASVMP